MQILKAYADAGATGKRNFVATPGLQRESGQTREQRNSNSGDSITLSQEALDMLENGGQDTLSTCPQDATYDQFGNVTRQFDSLQNDLRRLAAQFRTSAESAGMLGQISSLQSRLSAIKAQV